MTTVKFVEVHLGDEVRLRKPHPCGSLYWTVVRLGADIGLVCHKCQRRILLPRSQFERRLKVFLSHAGPLGSPIASSATTDELDRESSAG